MESALLLQAEAGVIHRPRDVPSPTVASHNTQHLIAKLPIELIVHIIRSGLDPPSQRSLSQVSRIFRYIFFFVPEFWSTIVPKFPLENDQLDYWRRSLANSKTAPLDVKLTIPDQNPFSEVDQGQGFLSLLPDLVINMARWRTFEFVAELPGLMDLFLNEIIPVAVFPQLENLRLACVEPIDTHDAAWFANDRSGEPSTIMPRLRNFGLWNVWMRYPRGILDDLVELRLIGDLGTMLPLEEIVGMLKSSPNLEVLCITADSPPINNLSPPPVTNETLHVALPRLRSLTFRGLSRIAAITILPLLHLPALEEFHLENTLAWLSGSTDVPDRLRMPEDYSSVVQIITYLNMPWERPSDVFTAPAGPQWPQGKLKELTLSWVTAEATPFLDWLSFMRELTTLRVQFSDVDLLRVLQDGNVCPQLQTLHVEGFMDPAIRSELERVMRGRPNLEVCVEATLAGADRTFRSRL